MIHWLVQSQNAHPALAHGIPPAGLLSAVEQAKFLTLITEKRRRDWLLGRWTAKHLLQHIIQQKTGEKIPLDAIIITNNLDGVPLCTVHRSPFTDYALSLSHCDGRAFCAVAERPYLTIGADMEKIEQRIEGFAEDYFTEAELNGLRNTDNRLQDLFITAVWSAKEAVLKALHLGLSVDTRTVTCRLQPVEDLPTRWIPFEIRCDEPRMGQSAPKLTGWWRTMPEFVLTVATSDSMTGVNQNGLSIESTNLRRG